MAWNKISAALMLILASPILTGCSSPSSSPDTDSPAAADSTTASDIPSQPELAKTDSDEPPPTPAESEPAPDKPPREPDRPVADNTPPAVAVDDEQFENGLAKIRQLQLIGKFSEAKRLVRSMQRKFAAHPKVRELAETEFQLKQLLREAAELQVAIETLASKNPTEVRAAKRMLRSGGDAAGILLRQVVRESDLARSASAVDLLVALNDAATPELLAYKIRLDPQTDQAKMLYAGLSGLVEQSDTPIFANLWKFFPDSMADDPAVDAIGRAAASYFAHVYARGAESEDKFDELVGQQGGYRALCEYFETAWRSGDTDRIVWARKFYRLLDYIRPGLRGEYYVRDDETIAAAQAAAEKAAGIAKAAADARLAADQRADATAKAAADADTDTAKIVAASTLKAAQEAAKKQEETKQRADAAAKAAGNYHEKPVFARVDRRVDIGGRDKFPNSADYENINLSARWTGMIDIPETGEYQINGSADEYKHLYIDGGKNLVAATGGTHTATITLTAGLHDIEYYFRHTTGGYYAHLFWVRPGTKKSVLIDETHLFTKRWQIEKAKETEK
ncbi:MAG: PA14 domain-containing protein [Planctomycetota bacterium]|nr:PA14 domain-containing protein [Planctomycetota bacterium]